MEIFLPHRVAFPLHVLLVARGTPKIFRYTGKKFTSGLSYKVSIFNQHFWSENASQWHYTMASPVCLLKQTVGTPGRWNMAKITWELTGVLKKAQPLI